MDIELGAYVLHALEPEEADTVQRHLTGCPACRDEVRSLASTASLLALLTPQHIEQHYDLEHAADDGAAGRTGQRSSTATAQFKAAPRTSNRPARPRRRRAVLALAAAVLAASTSIGAVRALTADHGRPNHGRPSPGIVQVVDPTTHVQAAVTMTSRSGGTQLHLKLTGAYPSGSCSLIAHSRDGHSDTAATWVADTDGNATVAGMTAIPTSRLSELDVLTDTGHLLVRIALPHHSK